MMDVLDARHAFPQIVAQSIDVEPVGRPFQQDMGGMANDDPGAAQDEHGDDDGEQGIDGRPARPEDDDGGEDGGDGAQKIAQHMERGRANVQIFAISGAQQSEHQDIHHQPQGGDDEHRPREDLDRLEQPPDGLEDDPADDEQKRHAVDESGQDLEPVIAVRAPGIGGAPPDTEAQPGERERRGVDQHVPGVGEQRQRAGVNPADHLDDHEDAGQDHGLEEAGLVVGVAVTVRTPPVGGGRHPTALSIRDRSRARDATRR